MLKDIFGSLGFVIVGSDILFWAYFFIMDNTCIPFVLINDRKMIDAKHVHKLLECKYDFKHGANGGGAATNGLLSMIPGMFANLIGGNKMDPNLVTDLRCVEVADVEEVVLIEEQTQRIQLIRNM